MLYCTVASCGDRKSYPGWRGCRDGLSSLCDARPLEAAQRIARRTVQIACGSRGRNGISPPAACRPEAVRAGKAQVERRRLVWTNVTANPTAEWIAQQITEAFPWDEAPRYLIRDRDTSYGAAVTRRLQAMGIRDRPIMPRSPWQNGHVERLIGSIRRE